MRSKGLRAGPPALLFLWLYLIMGVFTLGLGLMVLLAPRFLFPNGRPPLSGGLLVIVAIVIVFGLVRIFLAGRQLLKIRQYNRKSRLPS